MIRNTPQLSDSSNIVLKHMNGIISVFGRLLFLLIFARSIARRLFISVICFSLQRTNHPQPSFSLKIIAKINRYRDATRMMRWSSKLLPITDWVEAKADDETHDAGRAKFAVNYRYCDRIESDNAPCTISGLLRVCRVFFFFFNIHTPDLIYRRYRRETLPQVNKPRDKENDRTPEWKTRKD